MLTILAYSGIATLVLLLLYLIARRFPMIGEALAFLCVFVARLFVKLQGMLEKAGAYCYNVFEKTLHYPPNVASDSWQGVHVIARIILFLVSSIVLVGDLYNTLQSLPLLFGGAGAVSLPGSFAIPSALLFVAMSALYGAVVLECTNLLPYGAGLFPKMTEKVRKWLGVLCGIGFLLSLVFAVMFWAFRGWFLADPDSAGVLAITVFPLVGLLVTGASVLALWGLVIGLTGVLSVVFWLLYCGFHFAASFVSLVPSLLDVLALHFTQGGMSVYGDFLGHDPYKAPSSPFPASRQLLPGQNVTALLPQNTSTVDAVGEIVVPVETQEMENVLMNLEKNASVNCIGSSFGAPMFSLVAHFIQEFRATGNIKSSSFIVLPVNHRYTGIPGLVDMTPDLAKRHAVALHSDTQGEAYKKLMDDLGDTIIEVHGDLKAVPAPIIFIIDCYELVEAVDMLESIKRRYPLCSIVAATEVSPHDCQDKSVQVGFADLQTLVAENIVETVMVSHTNSALASAFGLAMQHRYLAHLLVSTVIANIHSHTNSVFVDVLRSLSSCVTTASASAPVAVGKLPKRLSWVPFVKGAGTGIYSDILAQSRVVIDKVLNDAETAMFPVPSDPGSRRVVIVTIPLQLSDVRFEACVQDNALYVSTHYSNTTCLTVRGNGCAPIHHIGSRFLVQASCITPVPNPTSLLRLQEGKQVKVTPLYPVTTAQEQPSSNSHVPALVQKAQTKTTKAARQKKATPARRVGRKNTKQAK